MGRERSAHAVALPGGIGNDLTVTRHARWIALQAEPDLMDRVAELVEQRRSINQIAAEFGVRPSKLRSWVYDDSENKRRYDDARKALADDLVHEALDAAKAGVGEEKSVARDKLIVETNLKVAGKLDSQYSDRVGAVNVSINNSTIDMSLGDSAASLLSKIRQPKTIDITPEP